MTEPGTDNILYYGDNLDILRRYIKDETIDLVYLDPPFNSNQDYNAFFKDKSGRKSPAQIHAFEDTWEWGIEAERALKDIIEAGGRVSQTMQAFRTAIGTNDMLAYLAMMAPRLVELRRVLKPTGSIYLHCDPTASHYLKMLMDAVFGPQNFVNEVIWKRATSGSSKSVARRFGSDHDILLFFRKSDSFRFEPMYMPYPEDEIEKRFRRSDDRGRYKDAELATYSKETLDRLKREDRLIVTPGGKYRYKIYLDEIKGVLADDVWTDIPPINSQAKERLGYPTQKPEALLERIIRASSNDGDLVLDPFCGCGTTVAVAQRLNRRWIGIDITHLAINLMKRRLKDAFGADAAYKVVGEPVDVAGARDLAAKDPYQFQWWALDLVDARPADQRKGSDKGIDGRIYFHDEADTSKTKQVIISVKAGHTGVAHVRDLSGVLTREKAEIGVLISMEEPTQPMITEAASAGLYHSPNWNKDYPRIQLRTIAELLEGKGIDCPQHSATFKQAPKYVRNGNTQLDAWTAPATTDAEPIAVSDKPRKKRQDNRRD